jgi:hypothetical protein
MTGKMTPNASKTSLPLDESTQTAPGDDGSTQGTHSALIKML